MNLKNYVKTKEEVNIVSQVRKKYVNEFSDFLIKEGKIGFGSIVLDIPCGTGDMSKLIKNKTNAKKFILLDINKNMINSAREKLGKGNLFIIGDAGSVGKLVKEKVDVIICLNGFNQYIDRKKNFLEGCKNILKANGRLIFDVSTRGLNDRYTRDFFRLLEREIDSFAKKYESRYTPPTWPDEKLLGKYSEMILGCGLKLLKKEEFASWKTIEKDLESSIKISGRSRPWLKGMSYKKRKEAFIESIRGVIDKIGKKKLEHNRIFFVVGKY